jgi:hypothetical protein
MILPRKKLVLPCHKNGYLQSASDARKYRDRFKRNPLAKVADMFVPKPLRMSPGYPCCCGETLVPCACLDAIANYCDSCEEVSVTIGGYSYICERVSSVSYRYPSTCSVNPGWDWDDGYPCVSVSVGCHYKTDESCIGGSRPDGWAVTVTGTIICNIYGGGAQGYCADAWYTLPGAPFSFPACNGTHVIGNPYQDPGYAWEGACACDDRPSPVSSVTVEF